MRMRGLQVLFGLALVLTASGCDQISDVKEKISSLIGGEKAAPKQVSQQPKPQTLVAAGQAASASGGMIKVGDKSTQVADYIVLRSKSFENSNDLEVYLFNTKLTDAQKAKLSDTSIMNTKSSIAAITGGALPVMHLWLMFDKNAKTCSADALTGMTVIFNKNQSFDFAVKDSSPINWSMSYSGDDKMKEYGFGDFSCSFENGGQVAFTLKNHWLADGKVFKDMLADGLNQLDFSWDLNLGAAKPAAVSAPMVEVAGEKITLNNYTIQSAAVSWIKEANLLKIMFFKKALTDKQVAQAAGNPPQFDDKDFVAGFYVEYNGTPKDFSELPVSVVAEVAHQGMYYSSDIELDKIYVSGKPEAGSPVSFQSKAEFTDFGGGLKPPLDWNFNIDTKVNKVN